VLQQCWLLRQVNEWQNYWYQPIPTHEYKNITGQLRHTNIIPVVLRRLVVGICFQHSLDQVMSLLFQLLPRPIFSCVESLALLVVYWLRRRWTAQQNASQTSLRTRVRPIPSRRPIPDIIGHSYADTDTGLYKFFVLKMQFCEVYRCVQVIYVCRVDAWKYGIGLKLQVCVATVLTVETGKRMTGLLVSAQISIGRYRYRPILASIGQYPIPDTGIGLTLLKTS